MINALYNSGSANSFFTSIGTTGLIVSIIVAAVVLVLKGFALWYSARREQKVWFIVLLVVNTLGILDLVYIIFIAKKWRKSLPANEMNTPTNV